MGGWGEGGREERGAGKTKRPAFSSQIKDSHGKENNSEIETAL